MPEEFTEEQQKLYQYAGNSGLVLQSDRSGLARRGERGKEIESLYGKIDGREMGSNVRHEAPPKAPKQGKTTEDEVRSIERKRNRREQRSLRTNYGYSNILAATDDIDGLAYRPKSRETRRVWDLILAQSRKYLSDQAPEVLVSAADEALAVLKNDDIREREQKKQVEALFGTTMPETDFALFVQLAKQITDYEDEPESMDVDGARPDAQSGVAVVFDGSEDEEGGRYAVDGESSDSDSDDEEDDRGPMPPDTGSDAGSVQSDGEAGGYRTVIHGYGDRTARKPNQHSAEQAAALTAAAASKTTSYGKPSAEGDSDTEMAGTEASSGQLSARSIDAFWLQRQVGKHFPDHMVVQDKTRNTLRLMANRRLAQSELENELAELFDYDHFDTVQVLVQNRELIVWGMKLARAEAEADSQQLADIEEEMRESGLGWIIDARDGVEKPQQQQSKQQPSQQRHQQQRSTDQDTEMDVDVETKAAEPKDYVPKEAIDLASLAFTQGGHLMTNERWVPPKGAEKIVMPGYEEIRVPAPERPPPPGDDEPTVSIGDMPKWSRSAFPGAKELNRVQSRVYPIAFKTDDNMLICAPTGAGKTNCAALTMMRTIEKFGKPESGDVDVDQFKMVYIAPMKALVAEMATSFEKRLAPLGIKVVQLTGDSQLTKQQITEAQLIVTTPEKWDVITRKGGEGSYTSLVRLVIIDEIHLLHDDRGPVLESLVCRLLRTQEQTQQPVRLVGLSATLPNYGDVAKFLRVSDHALFHFDARFRPCPLQQEFVGITEKKHIKRLERMDQVCYEKVKKHASTGQVLVFVHSRKETLRTAQRIRDMAIEESQTGLFVKAGSTESKLLEDAVADTKDQGLKDILPFGIGCHHAGMTSTDRGMMERLFADGYLKVLVSTATLAWGVNLPAHAVIIKGTQVYNPEKGCWAELSPQDVLQMLGRAGRPQYDTFGEGIIITNHGELRYYLSLLNQQLPIESQLVSRLADSLNAEVTLGTIKSRLDAVDWLGYTYLYIRMMCSPSVYGVPSDEIEEDPDLKRRRTELVHAAAVELERSQMITYDHKSGRIHPRDLGRVASHYYITHRSMAVYQQDLRADASDIDILRVFSLSDEFRLIPVRAEERVELQRLLERVPVPMRESADSPQAKINVLLQAYIANLGLSGFALVSDMVYVTQSAGRIFRALFELCLRRKWARAAHRVLNWCKQVERRMWLTMTPLRQFAKLTDEKQTARALPKLIRSVERKPFPWSRYIDLSAQELGELLNDPTSGREMHKLVHQVPRLDISAHVQPLTRSLLRFELRITPDFRWKDRVHGAAEQFWIWVEDADGEAILHSEMFVLKKLYVGQEHVTEFTCTLTEPLPPQYFVCVTSDRWIGSETRLAVSFKYLSLPDKSLPPTEVLDMQPLKISELHDPEFEQVYQSEISPMRRTGTFNAIQTQSFHTLYRTDDSVLLGASPGSGKTLAAEIALLRFFKHEALRARADGDEYVRWRAVYIAPFASLVRTRAQEWKRRFASLQGGKNVVVLSGDLSGDLKRIENAHIIVTTPGPWDALSRKWRTRQHHAVREIGLVIADEVHWVGGAGLGSIDDVISGVDHDAGADFVGDQLAATYEIIVSRIRYMAAEIERPIRIVALSVPLANARDVAAWIGAPSSAVFNFPPTLRPVQLDVLIQTSTIPHFASRMAALAAPTYRAVCGDPEGTRRVPESRDPAIVFVPSRRQCRVVAGELLTLAAADGAPTMFLRAEFSMIESVVEQVSDRALREILKSGVGYYHEALSEADRKIVISLFESGAIQVLVASRETCWALDSVHAHTVVIMGAERYNGREHRYTDYCIPDILQMMGRASRPGIDSKSLCVLMCMANKREFYTKFLQDPLPLESRLDAQLHDPLNSEIVSKTITGKQDAVDYLTWTLMYRRLVQNPNYYGLQGTSHQHLSDYLSELVESTINDLAGAKCVTLDEDEIGVTPTNLGIIAAFYQIRYLTVEMFALSLNETTKLRGVLDIVSAADEFEALPIRHREANILTKIARRCPVELPGNASRDTNSDWWNSPRVRTHVLLQAHFSRLTLPADLAADQAWVLAKVLPLLQAMVDVASSMELLPAALAAMELSQMSVQAVWEGRDSLVKQVPHLGTAERLKLCESMQVDSVFGVMDMEDEDRAKLLHGLEPKQIADVAAYVNRYPNIEVEFEVANEVHANGIVVLTLSLDREWDEDEEGDIPGPVIAPFFPYSRGEGWWVVIADGKTLVNVRRISVGKELQRQIKFAAPEVAGHKSLKMFLMCDGYLGCDQELDIELDVLPPEEEDSDSDE